MVFRWSLGLQNFNIIPQMEDDLARPGQGLVDLDQISPTFWGFVSLYLTGRGWREELLSSLPAWTVYHINS